MSENKTVYKEDEFKWEESKKKLEFETEKTKYRIVDEVHKDTGEVDYVNIASVSKSGFGGKAKNRWILYSDLQLILDKLKEYHPELE